MDEVTREGLAREVATSSPSLHVMAALERLVTTDGAPQVMRGANGPALIALAGRGWPARHQVMTRYIAPGCPRQDGYGARFHGTGRDACLHMPRLQSVAEARCCAPLLAGGVMRSVHPVAEAIAPQPSSHVTGVSAGHNVLASHLSTGPHY